MKTAVRLFENLQELARNGGDVEKAVRFWLHSHKNILRSEENKNTALLNLRELRHDLLLIGVSITILNDYLG